MPFLLLYHLFPQRHAASFLPTTSLKIAKTPDPLQWAVGGSLIYGMNGRQTVCYGSKTAHLATFCTSSRVLTIILRMLSSDRWKRWISSTTLAPPLYI